MQRHLPLVSLFLLGCSGPGPGPGNDLADPAEDAAAPSDDTAAPQPDGAAPARDLRGPADLSAPADLSRPDLLAPPPLVRFAAFGDTGKANEGQAKVAAAVATKCAASGCDFITLLGDNIYDSGVDSVDDPQWQSKFEVPYAAINLPFYAVLGNHDYGSGGAGLEFHKGDFEVKYTMKSMKWRMPGPHWHVPQKHVELFGLDTNLQMFNRVAQQKPDMKAWIAASTATWKIALGHHPYRSNGPHGNAGWYEGVPFLGDGVKKFMDDVVCGSVDLYICGHDHSRQWLTDTCKGTELAVSGAGAGSTDLPGRNPTRFESLSLGFLYVRVEGRTLTAEFIDDTGKVEFTRTLTK
jgi:tartrate-resistant acid phosphatase type 5